MLIQYSLPYCKDLNKKYGYFTSVNTLKEFRNKGYQHEIMEYLIDFAKKNQIKTLKLDSNNSIAIKIYQKYNFKIYEKDRVIMTLTLEE